MFGNKVLLCLSVVALVAALQVYADEQSSNFLDDIEALSDRDYTPAKVFDEQTLGFDSRDDKFYFQDNLVKELFQRKKFTNGLVTLGGQESDAVNTRAKRSTYPFAVAQRTSKGMGILSDRWDAKDVGANGVEFFALYHGEGNEFVVNKVRAHLLRRLANTLQEFVPVLDRTSQPDAAGHTKEVNLIRDEVRLAIENVFADVDQSIRQAMYDNDDSSATAAVVMVTPATIVVANVGFGQVLAYDDSSVIQTLTNAYDDANTKNVFGSRKSRQSSICKPHVEIFSRVSNEIQLVVIESPTVAQKMNNYELFRIVLSEVNQHKGNANNEQQIYSSSVSRILENSSRKGNPLARFFDAPDHTVMLIGLQRDYTEIH